MKILNWRQRAQKHSAHNGIVTERMIQDRMQEEIDELRKEREQVIRYATMLASAMHKKHWKKESPNWEPLEDPMGLLTQIDNMTCQLSQPLRK